MPPFPIAGSAGTGTSTQRIESYFALKWGTTLDQTTPTSYLSSTGTLVWDAAANATYKNNIAGLGREDPDVLQQEGHRPSIVEDPVGHQARRVVAASGGKVAHPSRRVAKVVVADRHHPGVADLTDIAGYFVAGK